jgi:DtxR family Mn-dependent transcriptional regulator
MRRTKMATETLTPSLEDYLEAVLVAGMDRRVVRVKDISSALNVTAPSVIGAMKQLEARGLVSHERYGYIELTGKGRERANQTYTTHKTLKRFLEEILGIDSKTAERDACRMEHYIGQKSLKGIMQLMRFIENCPVRDSAWLTSFQEFMKTGKRHGDRGKADRKGSS